MKNFKIFTESDADVKFISDYIFEHFDVQITRDAFYVLNSWSGYKNAINELAENSDNGSDTILILDADNDFIARQSEVINDFATYKIPVKLFLFPNDASDGNLENLLCEIATEREILVCFEAYEACIRGHEAPVIKSKVFAYLDALLTDKNKKGNKHDLIKEANRNYRNSAHWDLHHEYLQPLKAFLTPFFT